MPRNGNCKVIYSFLGQIVTLDNKVRRTKFLVLSVLRDKYARALFAEVYGTSTESCKAQRT